MEHLVKEKLNKPNFLYIASLVFLGLGFFLTIGPMKNGSYEYQGVTLYGNYMFSTIGLYALVAFLCYLLGIFKIKRYNNSKKTISDYKYEINNWYGLFNLLIILPLNFGLLIMIITNDLTTYATLIEVIGYSVITVFFLVSFILRKTLIKSEQDMGLLSFDANSVLYFGYAYIMVLLNYLGIKIDFTILIILFIINIFIVHISAYYPAKAMVYAIKHEEYNPIKTIYIFVRMLINKKVFFFIGLLFTLGLGFIYYWAANLNFNPSYILFFISMYYVGVALTRFFSYLWNERIERSVSNIEKKTKSLYKIMLFNSITTFIFTLLLASLFIFIFTDTINKEVSGWFILIQSNFVALRILMTIFDIIRNHKEANPYRLSEALIGLLYTLVLIYSFLLSLFMYFGLKDVLFVFSFILIISNISTGMSISGYMLVRSILGLKGIIKRKVE